MKPCSVCGESKPLATRSSKCKGCHNAYTRQHYADNKQYYIDKAKVRSDSERKIARDYLLDYLQNNPCVDCGEKDIVVLELDHKDTGTKVLGVGKMIGQGHPLAAIKLEVSKCDVRCCNCHRRRTAKQFGWWTNALVIAQASNL